MKIKFIFLSLCMGLVFFICDVSQPFAQDTEEFTLEEIVVTAAKRGEENLQKVPIAMEVISDKDLAAEGKANVDDILAGLASVFINTSADGMRISIRGVTDTDPVYGGRKSSSPTVAMNVDGAYNSMNSSGQNLFDVERIEILMGPQSTLYASNSPGGIVNIITTVPKTDMFSANASGEYGSYHHSVLQAAFNAPLLKDKIAMRLSLNRTRENSFLEPDELATKNDAARLKVLLSATDDLQFTLTGNYSKNGNRGEMGGRVVAFDKSSDDAWTAASNSGGPGGNALDQITKGGNANISWNSPFGNLTVVPSYSKSYSEGNQSGTLGIGPPGPDQERIPATWYTLRNMVQKGAEARIASPEDLTLLQYVVGVIYYKNQFDTSDTYYPPNAGNSTWNTNKSKQKAVYANITYPLPINEKLSVTAGYRKSWDYAHQIGYDPGRGMDETEMDVSKPDYKLGFQYDQSDTMMLYGSYASSFRTDSMAMSNNDGIRPPESLKAYTIGAKTRMLDNTLQLNTAAYYYDYKNKFAQDSGSRGNFTEEELRAAGYWDDVDQGRSNVVDGVTYYELMDGGFNGWGNARTIGADASISWIASSKDMVEVSVSYLDMKWTRLRFNYIYETFWPDNNYDGRTAPNAPKFSTTTSYEHNFYIGSYGTLTPRIDLQHKTGFDLVFDQSDGLGYGHQEAYFLWNASAAFNSGSNKWSVNAIVKNITNYAVKRSYEADQQTLMIGDPRTYSVTVSVKF